MKHFIQTNDEIQFDALVYLTAECNYGGRVTDRFDRRLITALLSTYYFTGTVKNEDYKFCADQAYYAPNEASYDSYIDYIRNLPNDTVPEVFGLHLNANISKDYKETHQLFDDILLSLPRQVF